MNPRELENRFTYHPPSPYQIKQHEVLRAEVKHLAQLIDSFCRDSMEKEESLKRLDEACAWASAAIARHGK